MPPDEFTASAIASKMVLVSIKSSFLFSLPCHVIVHPPVWEDILLAALPITPTCALGFSGRVCWLFLRSTSDSLTACLASSICRGWPKKFSAKAWGLLPLKRPILALTLSILVTASLSRSNGITPDWTCTMVFFKSVFQSSGAINISTPALNACAQLWFEQPGTWPCPFQSPTTKPSNCMLSFNTVVKRSWSPCNLLPFHELKLAITVWAQASNASKYG